MRRDGGEHDPRATVILPACNDDGVAVPSASRPSFALSYGVESTPEGRLCFSPDAEGLKGRRTEADLPETATRFDF